MRNAIVFTIALAFAFAQAPSGAAGSGPYAGPSVGAYALVANAAEKIVADNHLKGQRVVIYDAQVFSLLPTYQTAVLHLRQTMKGVCATTMSTEVFLVPSLDIGGAASGLAALLNAVTPAYAVQGQALPFDNSALVAAFAKQAALVWFTPDIFYPQLRRANWPASRKTVRTLWRNSGMAPPPMRPSK
jgi:hypothetical protein